jgi:hypothetical protein
MKRKKLSRGKLVKKLDAIFSRYIRLRHAKNEIVECFTCGVKAHYKDNMQCGHFQSRRFYSTRWDETNCQVQCKSCNIYKEGEQFKFGTNLNKQFGKKTSERLEVKAREIVKIPTYELEDMIKKYQELVKDLE